MKPNQIKIRTQLGELNIDTDKIKRLKQGKCKSCSKIIYFFKAAKIRDMIVSKINDEEYVSHRLVCPVAQQIRQKINLKNIIKLRRKNI